MNTREQAVRDVLAEQAGRAHDESRVLNRLAGTRQRHDRPKWTVPVVAAVATAGAVAVAVPVVDGAIGHDGPRRGTARTDLPSWRTGDVLCAYSNYFRVVTRPGWLPAGLTEKGRTAALDYSERYFTDGAVPDANQQLGSTREGRTVLIKDGNVHGSPRVAGIRRALDTRRGTPVSVHGAPGVRYVYQRNGATEIAWQVNENTVRLVSVTGFADGAGVAQRIADSMSNRPGSAASMRSPLLPYYSSRSPATSRVTVTGSDPANWSVRTGLVRGSGDPDSAELVSLRLVTTDPNVADAGESVRVRSFDGTYVAPRRAGQPGLLVVRLGTGLWLTAEGRHQPGAGPLKDELRRYAANTLLRCHSDTSWLGR